MEDGELRFMMFLAQCAHDFTVQYGLAMSLFLAGLVGGFSHCAWMCGPFVIAQIGEKQEVSKLRGALLIPYHFGRMTTYVLMGLLLSTVFNIVFVFSDIKTLISVPFLVIAGVVFLVTAFPRLAQVFPWVEKMAIRVPYQWLNRSVSKIMKSQSLWSRYLLGILLGFMPCGLVVSALMASSTAPSVSESAFAMIMFTIGTMPALILVALGGQAFKYKYPKASLYLSRGGMVLSSFWLFMLAGVMVF